MPAILDAFWAQLKPLRYLRKRGRFHQVVDGIFRLIDIQSGAYGNYSFVNLCIHPVGMPMLLAESLTLHDFPLESQCIVRQRIDQVSSSAAAASFRSGLVWNHDDASSSRFAECVATEAHDWLSRFGTAAALAALTDDHMISSVPLLRRKAFHLLKTHCLCQLGMYEEARNEFREYAAAPSGNWNFDKIDAYYQGLLEPRA